jgi:NADPH:quinone reductase-like Zn-dependent oxidoreductase
VWGVQLAHQIGAEAIGTCGASNVDFLKNLGADTVLDYRKVDLLGWVKVDKAARGSDVVLDCIGGATLTDAWKRLLVLQSH